MGGPLPKKKETHFRERSCELVEILGHDVEWVHLSSKFLEIEKFPDLYAFLGGAVEQGMAQYFHILVNFEVSTNPEMKLVVRH